MSAIIKGYEYDIFISYRQKDNKHDGWVTEFADNLKGELESTFKEEISVYFDNNPHDGLLETYDVDESLKDKLKCLIFIPIISRTYCDPKSFAWEHEFKAFVDLASKDQFGLKIKLPNGNVASRVLPVQIHDLDNDDINLCESVLEGVLRGVEFIYKSAGVNRPLRSIEDRPNDNLNKTLYRDQINKMALAIRDIITAIEHPGQKTEGILKEVVNIKSEKTKELVPKTIVASVIILALIVLGYFLIPKLSKPKDQLEKSIAVLPFVNDSPNQENTYFINGIMDEILNNLQKIKDFRVLSRTSTEQYRGLNKPAIPKIAKDLDINYIVEGSGQKYGNKFVLRVQLIAAKNERHIWGESYEREIKEATDIIELQSQIAQTIASELKSTITPEEKQLIEKIPTSNLTAYDFYQRGEEELRKYSSDNSNKQTLKRAAEMYRKALECDSKFGLAYIGLARVYYNKDYYRSYYSENFLDSVLILADLALTYDDHLAGGYFLRGVYYINNGNAEQALKEYDKALKYNPNYWQAYRDKALYVYLWDLNNADYIKAIQCFEKALSINHGLERPDLLRRLGFAYAIDFGFPEKAKYYYEEAFKLHGDSSLYLTEIGHLEILYGNFEEGIVKFLKSYAIDTNNLNLINYLGAQYLNNRQYRESLRYYKKFIDRLKSQGKFPEWDLLQIGFAYWQNGYKKEAEYWFREQKRLSTQSIKLGRRYSNDDFGAYFALASLYAFTGEKEKAYEILRMISQKPVLSLLFVMSLKQYYPLYDNIRNEPEFQKILKEADTKYQAEHERVRKWLQERGEL